MHVSAIKTIEEVVEDRRIAARNMIVSVPVGQGLVRMFGLPIKLGGMPHGDFASPPALGQHNEAVLRQIAGLSDEDILSLKRDGVI